MMMMNSIRIRMINTKNKPFSSNKQLKHFLFKRKLLVTAQVIISRSYLKINNQR